VSENAVAAVTVRFAELVPALYTPPVQLKLKVSVPAAFGVTVCVPAAARLPLHPPLAVHPDPFEDHVTTVDWPRLMLGGLTLMLTEAAGGIEPPP
jgi:hypothetical protein